MSFRGDPFRVLGLPSGASEDEIKRAYRALAKRYHPDSAGEAALPRFLAIQAAYDLLTGGTARPKTTPSGPERPSGAESERARASREAYRARRATPPPPREPAPGGWWAGGRPKAAGSTDERTDGPRPAPEGRPAAPGGPGPGTGSQERAGAQGSPPPSGSARGSDSATPPGGAGRRAGGGRTGATGRRGTAAGPTGRASQSIPKADPPPGGARGPRAGTGPSADASSGAPDDGRPATGGRRNRPPKVATLGSTSYDDAPAEREPSWSGATWYGGSSGTYWTLNPKEYADPRKHGPEYLARAQRRASGAPDGAPGAGPEAATEGDRAGSPDDPQPEPRGTSADPSSPQGPPPAPDGPAEAPPNAAGGSPRAGTTTAHPPRDRRAAGWRYQQSTPTDPWRARRPVEPRARTAPFRDTTFDDGPWPGDIGPRRTTSGDHGTPPPAGPGHGQAGAPDRGQASPWFDWGGLESKVPRRLLLAALAWPPLGYIAGAAIGEATGCGRYAATCSDGSAAVGTLVQPLIVLVLVLLPILARPAAVASIATAVAAVFGAVLLSIAGGARVPTSVSAPFLIAILVIGYAAGLAIAFSRRLPLPPWLARSG